MKQIVVWKSGYEQIEVYFNGYGQVEVDFNIFSNAITRSTRRHGTKPTLRYVNIPSLFSKGLTDATEEVFVVEGDSLNYNTAREPYLAFTIKCLGKRHENKTCLLTIRNDSIDSYR
jgi:hypothetical protein